MSADANGVKFFRLKIIDTNRASYALLVSRAEARTHIEWLSSGVGDWLQIKALDAEADRAPIEIIVGREYIVSMMLSRL